jgi:tetratricopeptide (TPR) repeat protein
MQRRAMAAVALTLGSLSAPAALQAQSRNGPTADTPRLLVAVFAGNDRLAGVQVAEAVRARISNSVNPRFLYVIPKTDITNYLESSGYKADSSLGPTDLKELAKLLRADEILFGIVTKTASGLRVEPRMLLARDPSVAQPLPAMTVANPNDAARDAERNFTEARKQLVDNRNCENALRDQKYPAAVAAANAGIAKYPNSTIARTCLASAYQAMKLPPDSVLRVAEEIIRLDPRNAWGYRFAFGAYQSKNEPEKAVRALITLMSLEPWNSTLQGQVIAELAKLGKPDVALPLVDSLLIGNPADPQLLKQKWLLSLAAAAAADSASAPSRFEQAFVAGEAMVRIDTTLADSTYYSRQLAAAATASPQRGAEFAARAVQRFPNNPELWAIKAQVERKAGQLQMAEQSIRRAISLDPKFPSARLLQAQLFVEMNMPDSTVAITRAAVAAGEDPKTWAAMLLGPANAAVRKAQESKMKEDWEKALALAEESDKLAPSAHAAFFIGIASFQIGIDALQAAQKPKSCVLARQAQDMFVKTQIAMPRGGQVDKTVAAQMLGYVQQYAPSAEQMVKAYCK